MLLQCLSRKDVHLHSLRSERIYAKRFNRVCAAESGPKITKIYRVQPLPDAREGKTALEV